MEFSNIKQKIKDTLSSQKRLKLFVAIGIIGMIIILLSEIIPQSSTTQQSSNNDDSSQNVLYSDYIDSLEEKTSNIIGSIDGVGECKVMITLENTTENVYAKNSDEDEEGDSKKDKSEYVLYDSSDGETPILIKEYFPKVQGVVVVCEGADDITVKEGVINSVSSLFNISTSRISVIKINQKGDVN